MQNVFFSINHNLCRFIEICFASRWSFSKRQLNIITASSFTSAVHYDIVQNYYYYRSMQVVAFYLLLFLLFFFFIFMFIVMIYRNVLSNIRHRTSCCALEILMTKAIATITTTIYDDNRIRNKKSIVIKLLLDAQRSKRIEICLRLCCVVLWFTSILFNCPTND